MPPQDIFAPNVRAVRSAFDTVRSTFGFQRDPDLIKYERLKADDFKTLAGSYGPDETARYIHVMESRRLNRR